MGYDITLGTSLDILPILQPYSLDHNEKSMVALFYIFVMLHVEREYYIGGGTAEISIVSSLK